MQFDRNINKDWVWHTYSPVELANGSLIFVQATPVHFARPLLSSQSTPSGRPVFSRLMLPTNTTTEFTSKSYVSNESGSKRRKLQPAPGAVGQNQHVSHPVLKIIGPDNAMHNTARSTVTVTPVTDENELVCQVLCELSNHKPVHQSQAYGSRKDVTEDEFESFYKGERSTDSASSFSSATRSESSPASSPPRKVLSNEQPKRKKSGQDDDDSYDDNNKSERRRKPRYRIKRSAPVLQSIKPDPAARVSSPYVDLSKILTPVSTSLPSVAATPAQVVQSRQKKIATPTPAQKSRLTIHVSKPVQQVFSEKNPEPKKHKRAAINHAGRKMAELSTTDSACSAPLALGRTRFTVAIS